MMKKIKLKLSRETIARLTNRNLAQVAGGTRNDDWVAERNEDTDTGGTIVNGSYVHQTQVYACNKSAAC